MAMSRRLRNLVQSPDFIMVAVFATIVTTLLISSVRRDDILVTSNASGPTKISVGSVVEVTKKTDDEYYSFPLLPGNYLVDSLYREGVDVHFCFVREGHDKNLKFYVSLKTLQAGSNDVKIRVLNPNPSEHKTRQADLVSSGGER